MRTSQRVWVCECEWVSEYVRVSVLSVYDSIHRFTLNRHSINALQLQFQSILTAKSCHHHWLCWLRLHSFSMYFNVHTIDCPNWLFRVVFLHFFLAPLLSFFLSFSFSSSFKKFNSLYDLLLRFKLFRFVSFVCVHKYVIYHFISLHLLISLFYIFIIGYTNMHAHLQSLNYRCTIDNCKKCIYYRLWQDKKKMKYWIASGVCVLASGILTPLKLHYTMLLLLLYINWRLDADNTMLRLLL